MAFPQKIYGLVAAAVAVVCALQAVAFAANPSEKPTSNTLSDPLALASSVGLKPQFNLGPVSVGGRYDSTLGAIAEARYSHLLNNDWAIGLLGEYGAKNARINTTLGYQFNPNAQVKVTGEYLSQRLPFYFDSGRMDERVGQGSYGFQLRQNFEHLFFQNVQAGAYWSDAPSHSLATLDFINSSSLNATNERHIAGSTSRGFNLGSDLGLGPNTKLNATAIYDSINYDTKLSTSSFDRSGFGAALTLEQLLTERMKLSLKAENRPLIDSYSAALQWLPESIPLTIALMSQRLVSNDHSPDSNVFGINIGFALDNGALQKPGSKTTTMSDLKTWVQQPAVRMERVQVRSEQRSTITNTTKIIFVTASSYDGNLTGAVGGDARCNSDANKPNSGFAAGYTYKALLAGNNATTSGVSYYRPDGTTLIAVATGGDLVGASNLVNSISTPADFVWTGASGNNCSNWTTANVAVNGGSGRSNVSSASYWNFIGTSCNTPQQLYCVSQ